MDASRRVPRSFRRLAAVAALATSALVADMVPSPSVSAHHLTGPDVCGAGTYVTRFARPIRNDNGGKIGTVWLTKHEGSSDTFCAATTRRFHQRRFTSVKLGRLPQNWRWRDAGRYRHYAGPPCGDGCMYLERNGKRLKASGRIGAHTTYMTWGPKYRCWINSYEVELLCRGDVPSQLDTST